MEKFDRRAEKSRLVHELADSCRAVLIVNTGSRRGERYYSQAKRLLMESGVTLDGAYPVRHAERLPEIVKEVISRGHKFVIIGGGDGTISSVAGQFAYKSVILGVLPFGTANSFARSLGIPLDIRGAINVLISGKVVDVDLGMINDNYFANGSSIGLPASVGRATPRFMKRWLGRFAYVLVAAAKFPSLSPFRCTVTIEGQKSTLDTLDVRIASGGYQGGVLMARQANVDDGNIIVQVLEGTSKLAIVSEWTLTALGMPLTPARTTTLRAPSLDIDAQPRQHVAVDGEVVTQTPVRISVAREALLVKAPHEFEDHDE